MRKNKKSIAIILIITFIMSMTSINIIAKENQINSNESQEVKEEIRPVPTESEIVKEEEEKREKNIKHFLKEDSSLEAVIYSDAIHYEENGKWEEIDNTLVEKTDAEFNKEAENSEIENKEVENEIKENKNKVNDSIEVDNKESNITSKEDTEKEENKEIKKENQDKKILEENKLEENKESPKEKKSEKSGNLNEGSKSLNIINTSLNEKNNVLENKKNNFKVTIAKDTRAKKLIKVKKGKHEVSWGLINPNSSKYNIKPMENNKLDENIKEEAEQRLEEEPKFQKATTEEKKDIKETIVKNEKKKVLKNLSSTVEFKEVYSNIDVELQLKSNFIKENIIIKKPVEDTNFTYKLDTKNLKAYVTEEKEIIFKDAKSKEDIFTMEIPYMIDAKGEISKDINIELINEKNNTHKLVIKPSKEWLNDSNRAYPVKIDPPVRSSLDVKKIKDSFVASGLPTTNYKEAVLLGVGQGNYSKTTRSFLKFDLPKISSSDMVIDAKLYSVLYSQKNDSSQINVHKVLADWDSKTITWNNKPNYNSKIEDYAMVSGKPGDYFTWDITSIAKEWYTTGNNFGLMLKNHNEGSGYTEFLSSDTDKDFQNIRPQIVLYYVNNSGLEEYWSYHSQEVGRAGTGHINDYNGNLVFMHNDVNTNGSLMPVSISHVYNSTEKDTNVGFGLGWRLNYYQRIEPIQIEGKQWYAYTDGDGTKHYFKYDEKEKKYKDDSGLDLKLTIYSDGRYEIKDKDDNIMIFTKWGYLYILRDKNNNELNIQYNGNKIKTITDGAGRQCVIGLFANGNLGAIIDPAGRRTSFSYTGDNLTRITYPDGNYTLYEYNSDNTLKLVTNYDGYQMQYQYYGSTTNRVKNVLEKHSNGTLGGEINLSYGFNQTSFKDVKGRKNIYQFNDSGNTVSVKDTDESAQYYKYFNTGDNKNKLELESKLQKTIKNYLKNHNIESNDSSWSINGWRDSIGSGEISTKEKYIGSRSLKINKTNDISRHFYTQTLNLEKGKTYTLSSYVKTNNISDKNSKGASVFVNYQDEKGEWITAESRYLTGNNDWTRLEVSFTIPKDAVSAEVSPKVGIISETGTAYFDCIQLEEGSIANRYNLVENSNFMYTNGGVPLYWGKSAQTDSNDKYEVYEGRKSFKLNGDATKNKNINQDVSIQGSQGDVFVLSGWAKADSVPLYSKRHFALDIGIKKKGTNEYQWVVVPFNQDSSEWQFVSEKVVAKHDYDSITVYGLYYLNGNTAHFSDIQLFKDEFGDSYTYDSKGNVISVEDLSKQKTKFEYNGNNDLIKSIDPKGSEFKYEYDSKHNITKATTSENVVYSFTYDNKGNPLTSKVSGAGLFIQAEAEYTASKNYMKSMTDSSGNKISYNWDETKGLLNKAIDSKGNETNYKYDNLDRITSVQKNIDNNEVTNNYTYENDNIKTVSHNGFSYIFNYDVFGNTTSVNVGSQQLISNKYEARTGKLLESTYGNGHKTSLDYDSTDAVIGKRFNGQLKYKYEYDASGNLGYKEDLENGVNYRYIYDVAERLIKVEDSKGNYFTTDYDKNNNKNKIIERINGKVYTTSYSYDKDNRVKDTTLPSGSKVLNNYDGIGRITKKEVNTGKTSLNTTFNFEAGYKGSQTNRISSMKNNDKEISYTYDKNGNIETIKSEGKLIKYHYNSLNEVIREDNEPLGKTIVYNYDVGGNITSKTEYEYNASQKLGKEIKTYNYVYGDPNWKDKLTSFDGKEITYDQIGNPLTYDGYNFTWEHGRRLKSIKGNNKNISYKYNDSGIRTEKNINGEVTRYHLNGSDVAYEETLDSTGKVKDSIYYNYDSSNHLVSMTLNSEEYFYIRNAQNDIIALTDKNGKQVVNYSYDTWGKLISIEGSLKDSVGIINPYRYRGYRYDTETGLYYLQSRYYNPEWSRFINADDTDILTEQNELLGKNLFAYCTNDPVNHCDDDGFWKISNKWKVAIGIAGIGVAVAVTVATGGTATPALLAALKVAGTSAISGGGIGAVSGYIRGGRKGALRGAINGAASGFMWGGLSAGAAATKGFSVLKVGKLKPSNKPGNGYYGVKYMSRKKTKSFEFHTPHNGHGYHWQMNKWNPRNNSIGSKGVKRWKWYGKKF